MNPITHGWQRRCPSWRGWNLCDTPMGSTTKTPSPLLLPSATSRLNREPRLKPLRLNGKLLDLNPQRPSFERIKSFLDKQSDEDLFTCDVMIERCGVRQLPDIS